MIGPCGRPAGLAALLAALRDERLSSCVDELMRLYRAVWRAGVSSHARRPPGCGGDLAWLSRRGVDYDLSSLFVFMQQQPNQH